MPDIIFELIKEERKRQQETLQMIPSENHFSANVRKALGSVLMNKYAEGRPYKRYYQGNKNVDQVEAICQERALKAFQLDPKEWGVNVQAYSGGVANFAVLSALLPPMKGKIMGMYLPDGGHLSHGWSFKGRKINASSKFWQVEFYHINPKTRVFDYDEIRAQAKKYKPDIMISGGTAYPREINHKKMGAIAHEVGAYYFADIAHEAGLVSAGVNTSPFPHADVVMVTTHKTLRSGRGALIFGRKDRKVKGEDRTIFEAVDFEVFPGLQGGPHMHAIAGIAVGLEEALQPSFKKYAQQVIDNAQYLANMFKENGFDVVSGGTDKHLVLIDLRDRGLSGWPVAWALEAAGIVANYNTVPNETASPMYPSGLRFGTPALTTRGMKEKEMKKVGQWMMEVIDHVKDKKIPETKEERMKFTKNFKKTVFDDPFLKNIRKEVKQLGAKFPIP